MWIRWIILANDDRMETQMMKQIDIEITSYISQPCNTLVKDSDSVCGNENVKMQATAETEARKIQNLRTTKKKSLKKEIPLNREFIVERTQKRRTGEKITQ